MLFAFPSYQFPYIVMNRCLYLNLETKAEEVYMSWLNLCVGIYKPSTMDWGWHMIRGHRRPTDFAYKTKSSRVWLALCVPYTVYALTCLMWLTCLGC
jgi:hypothetical protein